MSMATRCMTCGTIFRVVQDQLKVSEGWVRCGRCDEVFNALDGLFDLETESPPPWQPGQAQMPPQPTRPEDAVADLDEGDRIASRFFDHEPDEAPPASEAAVAEALAEHDRIDAADAGSDGVAGDAARVAHPADAETEAAPDVERKAEAGPDVERKAEAEAGPEPERGTEAAVPEPAFVRAANARSPWDTPRARRGLSVAAAVLAAVLALQLGHHFRDGLAADAPSLRPLLGAWCAMAGCRLEAPRRIEQITVENTGLTRAAANTDTYRLSVTLRNRAGVSLRTPSVDLVLTDTAGQLVARRALHPADFRAADTVAANSETALQLLLSAGSPRVSGYTIELFYP